MLECEWLTHSILRNAKTLKQLKESFTVLCGRTKLEKLISVIARRGCPIKKTNSYGVLEKQRKQRLGRQTKVFYKIKIVIVGHTHTGLVSSQS